MKISTIQQFKKIASLVPLLFLATLMLSSATLAAVSKSIPTNFVLIRGGEFTMGSPESEPGVALIKAVWQKLGIEYSETQHQVRLSSFYMSKYAVTVAEFRRFVEATAYRTDAEKEGRSFVFSNGEVKAADGVNWRHGVSGTLRPQSEENHPVLHVSWNDAVAYCRWMTKKTGKQFRLPTEAEREYACRAGTLSPFNTGENLTTAQANYNGNYPYNNNQKGIYRENTVPVNSFAPNGWGLYNMHGNVFEWCSDWYSATYYDECKAKGTVTNPSGPATVSYRVIRGGSWFSFAESCRSAYRRSLTPVYRSNNVGFRLVFVP
jgi:sulfatase modifying factor 1